ncbi:MULTISPECIES: hypothetical protein [Vibrio harveyi group]|uniref:hypothetical protein n=1 Tax=Vibrio harveyi group TaxID=717610 RepID=UPI00084A325E|nr:MULTISPECIES: hypothetical protein [Vibrio harveyi group]EGQ8071272.1 hypothetical protein [Vibrio parahaemolyticus]EHW0655785.1 hypothetical protein [Vibrio parahaemolyticus]EIU7057063.1 hypothetical protein [Vibrio parahaemolyticus]EJE4700395.1 hypothetical protein [Vibrio parahaemolyticus]ELA9558575.1 hypothetical protein [Vibrio parahaemolyticus]
MANFERMETHLDDITDPSLVILKSHLLVEEALFLAIQKKLVHPKYLINSRLSFAQLLILTKALYFKEEHAQIWNALDALNKARNKLAHCLEPEGLDVHLKKACFFVQTREEISINNPEIASILHQASGFLIGFTSSLTNDE